MDLIERVSCARKAKHIVRELHSYERTAKSYKEWSSPKSLSQLYSLFYDNLSAAAKCLLRLPQSTWTVDDLEQYAIDPRKLETDHRRGCYLLAAVGLEGEKEAIELYIGHSIDMTKRFSTHRSNINNLNRAEDEILYFHRRCRQLGVTKPLFIRLSNEPSRDEVALKFQESAFITVFGTWGARNVPQYRTATWKAIRKMRLANEHDNMPDGWHGANQSCPMHGFDGSGLML